MQQWPTQHILLESFHKLRNMESHTLSIRTMGCSCSCVAPRSPKDQDHVYLWNMDVQITGKQPKCTISDCATHVPFAHAQLPLLVNVHRETAKKPLPLTISCYQECHCHNTIQYNALFTFRVAKMLCFLLPNF